MSEWWTYRLSDFLLFSPRTYFRLFELHNEALWPWQIVALAAGLALVAFVWRGGLMAGPLAALVLACAWAASGYAWHYTRYETINWAAPYFALAFALQAALLVASGAAAGRLSFDRSARARRRIGLIILLAAVLAWPLVPAAFGRPLSQAEIFGLTPDPTAIATLGVLLTASRFRWELAAIPLLSCGLSVLTLYAMDAWEGWLVAAVALSALTPLAVGRTTLA